ncbi:hypothetical protein GGS20DRAFT_571766 [Poronia punctata]|nr:hypothetical protein GGS20DRAFT_571766 [Poronia punctata]
MIGTSSGSVSRQLQSAQISGRRSAVQMNVQLQDSALPAPAQTASESGSQAQRLPTPQSMAPSPLLMGRDPLHTRAPSLGELHQELEAEQEGQVNRLLHMIRQQQLQLQQLQATQTPNLQTSQNQPSLNFDDTLSSATRSASISHSSSTFPVTSGPTPRSPSEAPQPRFSDDASREILDVPHRTSITPSRGSPSPRLPPGTTSQEAELNLSNIRDEVTYYQAETQSLSRENQMLRNRIHELERQLREAQATTTTTGE